MDAHSDLLTVRDVAARLQVSRATVRRWVAMKTLPAITLPSGAFRFREADLEEWLAKQLTTGEYR